MTENARTRKLNAPTSPTCSRCGTAVAAKGELCAVCQAKKPAAPSVSMNLHPQPEPPYVKGSRNFSPTAPARRQ